MFLRTTVNYDTSLSYVYLIELITNFSFFYHLEFIEKGVRLRNSLLIKKKFLPKMVLFLQNFLLN